MALVKVVYDNVGGTPIPPIGILMVGGELRKAGCEVRVFHLGKNTALSQIAEIVAFNPHMLGFSLITGDPLDVVVEMTRQLDAALPECRIVYGGVHPTLEPVQCLDVPGVDFVVMHEGERTAVQLAEALAGRRSLDDISGLAYWKNGKTVVNPHAPFERDLDAFDIDWSLVDIERYIAPEYGGNKRVLMGYVATRGCPHQCAFCYNAAFNGRQWRHPSVAKVVRDVNALVERHRLGGMIFHDDNFTANRKWALDVLEGLKVPALHVETRIDYVNDALLQQLVDRKVQSVFFGVESGSDRILELLRKGFVAADIKRSLSLVNKYPLLMKLSIILGSPTETIVDHRATLDLIVWCIENLPRARFTIGFYLPFPGTPLFDLCRQCGFERPGKLEDWVKLDRWGNQETRIPWTDGEHLTSREAAKLRRWSGDLIRLRASSRWRDRLVYGLLRWRFRSSGSRFVRAADRFARQVRWQASRLSFRGSQR